MVEKLEEKTLSPYGSIWRTWHNVTIEETWAWAQCRWQIYKSTGHGTMSVPFYSNKFTRDRFDQIFWMLRPKTIPTQDAGPLTASRLLPWSYKFEIFEVFYESVIKFKGRISFITYNPKKPAKRGIRVYTTADSNTGHICGILPCSMEVWQRSWQVAPLCNVAGENTWCSRTPYVHRSLSYEFYLGRRIIEIRTNKKKQNSARNRQ